MNNAEESTKIAKETRFAVLGRAIADNATAGESNARLILEAQILRRKEQDGWTRMTSFAALTRQLGDAARSGKDLSPILVALVALRASELGTKQPQRQG